MKVKYEDRLKQKVIAITTDALVAGVDIAKNYQWARFVDFRDIEHDRALKFKNNRGGFETILARMREICKKENFSKVVVGMEPTGHYWKAFANWLEKQYGIKVVLVNPYATKQAKELDDSSQTKSDKKDALTIAKLVKDGRYFELYLPHDVHAELRGLSATRTGLNKRRNALKNTITAVMDEFFPEYAEVFKYQIALTMAATNDEMKQLYRYLKTREKAPLQKMQALVVISKKILALIHALAKKKENYNPDKVFGHVRREQLGAAA